MGMISKEPNSLLEPIHNRMPVILEKKDEDTWLNPDETEPAHLVKLLHPYPASGMEAYQVSTLVNSPSNDTKEVIKKVGD